VVKEGPDAEVQAFRLADVEVHLRTIKRGPNATILFGVLANRAAMSHSRFIATPCFRLWEPFLCFAMASVRREKQPGGVGPERGCI
jgi:hypothetical protein